MVDKPSIILIGTPKNQDLKAVHALLAKNSKGKAKPGAERYEKVVPVMTGTDAISKIKENGWTPDSPLVVIIDPSADSGLEPVEEDGVMQPPPEIESWAGNFVENGFNVLILGRTGTKAGQVAREIGCGILSHKKSVVAQIYNAAGVPLPVKHQGKKTSQQRKPTPQRSNSTALIDLDERNKPVGLDEQSKRRYREANLNHEHEMAKPVAIDEVSQRRYQRIDDMVGADAKRASGRRLGRVIAFSARKGGVGKTTLAVNCAAYLAKVLKLSNSTRDRVCVVDMNVQQPDVTKYVTPEGHSSYTNVVDLVRNPALQAPEEIEKALVQSEEGGFHALLGPAESEFDPNELNPDLFDNALEALRQRFDYIIVDTPVAEYQHPLMNLILARADYLVVPVAPMKKSLNNIASWLEQVVLTQSLGGRGFPRENVGLVLNRHRAGIGITEEEIQDSITVGQWLATFVDDPEWLKADNESRLVGAKPSEDDAEAFQQVLYYATQDRDLHPDKVADLMRHKKRIAEPGEQGGGLMDKIKSLLGI